MWPFLPPSITSHPHIPTYALATHESYNLDPGIVDDVTQPLQIGTGIWRHLLFSHKHISTARPVQYISNYTEHWGLCDLFSLHPLTSHPHIPTHVLDTQSYTSVTGDGSTSSTTAHKLTLTSQQYWVCCFNIRRVSIMRHSLVDHSCVLLKPPIGVH